MSTTSGTYGAGVTAVGFCRHCLRRVWLYEGSRWVLADSPDLDAHWCGGVPNIEHEPIKVRPMLLKGGAS